MVANKIVSASSGINLNWNQIDWSTCEKNTQRLQARIVQAVKERRWNKVKALQRLLTRSFSAKALAVKRVTTNRGKYTAGIDSQLWQTVKAKEEGIISLKQQGYKPAPLKQIYIPKADGGRRKLGIPTMRDRAMQALYLLGLSPIAETIGDMHSYGFRTYRSAADAISQIFIVLSRTIAPQYILEYDIEKCFDNIDHSWLMNSIPIENGILRGWLKSGFMKKEILFPTARGTPQGGVISPVLANMALEGLETILGSV